jgi:hypothetical protein
MCRARLAICHFQSLYTIPKSLYTIPKGILLRDRVLHLVESCLIGLHVHLARRWLV